MCVFVCVCVCVSVCVCVKLPGVGVSVRGLDGGVVILFSEQIRWTNNAN